ncbi:MAG: hypothetical protein ACE5HV_00020 [Acidobacteriota bacterium]
MPVSSYAPELLELFKAGAQKLIRIQLPDPRSAARLRFRLNNLRKELRREDHPFATVANGVQLGLERLPDGTAALVAKPADDDFLPDLRRAGVEVTAPPAPPVKAEASAPVPKRRGQKALQAYFDREEK